MSQHLFRQSDIIPKDILTTPIFVIGAGAIGSFTVLALAKMGFDNIRVMDEDKIETENLNAQFYRFKDIGKFKVDALEEIVQDFTAVKLNTAKAMWSSKIASPGVMIVAVDNMETRKAALDACKITGMNTKLVIDPRMSAESALIYAYEPQLKETMDSYAKSLYSDLEAVQERCTAKSTIYTVLGISSMIAAIVKARLTDQPYVKYVSWDFAKGQVDTFTRGEVA